ncbi:zinc finger CCCH-type with G patch domain-containing protein isoform X2 [Manduca sexta]|uniref:zinc finger CCCH-type with G patch domain-containing protein isoform X2 n=1 Tax=Manduca sexta TaxID=7130 RepID=UPI00188DFE83|nr:zinc finger CCCH-type with G patch domain-containing protein isoform X2 [Manduca sexta]
MGDLHTSLDQYQDQLSMVNQALENTKDGDERESLLTLKANLQQLIQLTKESLDTMCINSKPVESSDSNATQNKNDLDDEYALFMQEMAETDAYNSKDTQEQSESADNSDIEDELSSLPGMKCAVYYTHKWGGQASLHNAMVSAIVPRQDDDQFTDLQVCVLFTHPTHAEMLPCPFFLNGECRFDNEQCRYSHGYVTPLSALKEAIEPNFASVKVGSRVLIKLRPPDDEDINLTKKASEKYHLWHRAVIKSINSENNTCIVKLEQRLTTGEKRKVDSNEYNVRIEDIYPLSVENEADSDSSDDLSDTEYPDTKTARTGADQRAALVQKSLQNNSPAMGEWERHTRGIGSKLMLAMGYVPGTGLGASGEGRVQPVEARVLPVGKSLDQCMAISEKNSAQDPLKVEQRLKRLQKREEDRNKRAYEREKERERRNVFNFINKTLGDKPDQESPAVAAAAAADVKQSSSKDLNIEQFKITEDTKKIERDIIKLNNSLIKYPPGTNGHRSINLKISEKTKELSALQNRERDIVKEQRQRKDKHKMTVF